MKQVVIFAALPWERQAVGAALGELEAVGPGRWRGRLGDGTSCVLIETGIGPRCAEVAAAGAPAGEVYLVCGAAGALADGLRTGDVVAARDILATDVAGAVRAQFPTVGEGLAAWAIAHGESVHVGDVLSGPRLLTSVEAKAVAARTGALVVDMESAAVAEVARVRGVRVASLRVVLDTAAEALPFGAEMVDLERGGLRRLGLARSLVRPSRWSALRRLARQQRTVVARLRRLCGTLFAGDGLAPLATPERSVRAVAG